eukprot:CAMPEP_0202448296 /NCGR_PEP_ID=MMETSP1360-20130828/7111_1 /ASSEMBLY_ACC=CAM_ASM_000848 /TAXON_ID=515479 /ORGANISM="Licmophora paradoxa, Strain CCMP2313" /LENGTH=142 /DNA_ID=CAMNT_0049065803 /DNA_START=45 /DNA_END=473 /DNA_ORIENTATION=-
MAVGFFMGGVVAMSQLFFMLFLIYIGFGTDQKFNDLSAKEESLLSLFSLVQSILLASFAAILGAHRSEILIDGQQQQQQQQQLQSQQNSNKRGGMMMMMMMNDNSSLRQTSTEFSEDNNTNNNNNNNNKAGNHRYDPPNATA